MVTKILITDDDLSQRMILRLSLEEEGYKVFEAENGEEALKIISADMDIRLLLTDLDMPEMDGFELIRNIRKKELRYTYIIVLSSAEDRKIILKALSLGADDYLTKPVYPDELKLRLKGGIRLLSLEAQEELIFAMAKLAEYRSDETGFHLERTTHYVRLLARQLSIYQPELQLSLSEAEEMARVCSIHDLGKVAIPDQILHKPGMLTKEEFSIMKSHTTIGGKMINELYEKTKSSGLWLSTEIATFHHERWDGLGYPKGLSENDIPLSARIMALADVYDAMTSKRCYKDAAPHDTVKHMILEEKGKQFDPIIVDSFIKIEKEWLEIKNKFKD